MHVGHDPVEVLCCVSTQVVHAHFIGAHVCDVVLHRVRSKNGHLPRAMSLDILWQLSYIRQLVSCAYIKSWNMDPFMLLSASIEKSDERTDMHFSTYNPSDLYESFLVPQDIINESTSTHDTKSETCTFLGTLSQFFCSPSVLTKAFARKIK